MPLLTFFILYFTDLIVILFVATRNLCHVIFKKEEDVTILCNSGLVTQRLLASASDHELKLMYRHFMSFGITEPLQSCSFGYLSLKDLYT